MGGKMQNKVVWITGASSGIGHAMALRFAHLGAQVVATARRMDRLEQTKAECESTGGKCAIEHCDVTSIESVDKYLLGVVYYQTRIKGDMRFLKCHGHMSIYKYVLPNLMGLSM